MQHTKRVTDVNELRSLAFPPPCPLMDSIVDAESRGQKWQVIMAYERTAREVRWVAVLPGPAESRYFSEENQLQGRWDPDHEIFISAEGPAVDLQGKAVSLSSIEEDEAAEDSEEEERKWEIARHHARENGSLSWGQGEC
jgi:hypothetical protein